MYKTLGFKWLFEVFCPASAFATAESDEARNPQHFIHVSVGNNFMKRKINIGLILIFIIGFAFYCSNNFLTTGMISGKYTFKNSNSESCLAESPNSSDTLILFENGTFTSNLWGKGTYRLKHSFKGTSIDLTYDYEFGKAGYKTTLKRDFFSDPRIIINEDLNQYMERIEK